MTFALVLSGGGTSGVAWQTGLLKGLRDSAVDLTGADLVVGTSAGAIVGAQLTTGCNLQELYERQARLPDQAGKPLTTRDLGAFRQAMATVAQTGGRTQTGLTQAARAQIGAMALAAELGSEESRLATIESYLPVRTWPKQRLLITAVDVADGEFVVWDKDCGVPLLQAVASSCAAPMVVPPITINGRRYMDGGLRSGTSADLATGYDLVVVIAVSTLTPNEMSKPGGEIAGLLAGGSHVELLLPDGPSQQAIFPNVLDPARTIYCAQAGFAQGVAMADSLRRALDHYRNVFTR
jgi:NTE family protein